MRFSVLIPTYNRPADLLACIDSIVMQNELPAECVIVDDGSLTKSEIEQVRDKLGPVGLTYYKKDHTRERRGLSESKNVGFALAQEDIVFVFDDDIVLEQNFFSSIMGVWRTLDDERLMGVGGVISNLRGRSKIEHFYNSIFFLTGKDAWDITPVGFQVWDELARERQRAYYVHGGLSSLCKSRAAGFAFNTFKGGRTALEDVDFCMRAKNAGYYFYVEPRARAVHNTSPQSRESLFDSGLKESRNRKEIFRNNSRQSLRTWLWFGWSSIGWVLRQFLAGNFHKGTGMLVGLVRN